MQAIERIVDSFRAFRILREKRAIVADIGSTNVALALTVSDREGAHIEALAERYLPLEERSITNTIALLRRALAEAAEEMLKKRTPAVRIDNALAVIHAPWTRSETSLVVSKLGREQSVDETMIAQLAGRANFEQTDLDTKNIIEFEIVRILLNGYPTALPAGKRAHEIAVAVLRSDCHAKVRSAAEEILTQSFSVHPIFFRSATSILLNTMSRAIRLPEDYMLVDMTSEATSMTVVRDSLASDHLLVPIGIHSIVRRIAGRGMPEETLSLMRLIFSEQCETEACNAVQKRIASIEPDLVHTFGESMSMLASHRKLPNTMLIAVSSDFSIWLSQFFSRIDFAQFTVQSKPFTVELLTAETISPFVTFNSELAPNLGVAIGAMNLPHEYQGRGPT